MFENGKAWTEKHLFNGQYFIQKIDLKEKALVDRFDADGYWNQEKEEIKYQIAGGCSIDQLLGQWHAGLLGLGEIFNQKQMDTALDSMYKLLYKPSMRAHTNPWRLFCLNDEAGTVICEYPEEEKKPCIPIPYCEETMTGFEYAFAGTLILGGKMDKALTVVKAIRDRYDGKKRNPYNEIECGSNYARAMAAFALLPLASGFQYDLSKGFIGFAPVEKKEEFQCFFSLGTGWGEYRQTSKVREIYLAAGTLSLCGFGIVSEQVLRVEIDGKSVAFSCTDGEISFKRQKLSHSLKVILE